MNIGFDAKRAFHNGTGLGHYSRTLLQSLSKFYPYNRYYLFNPGKPNAFDLSGNNLHEINPSGWHRLFPSAWRSSWVKKDLHRLKIDLYHGLSHEIPIGIRQSGLKSVVTIHDLIHERFPGQYTAIDAWIYRKKFRYACEHADKVIAISEQTKKDIIEFYKTDPGKVQVCYQACNPAFGETVPAAEKNRVKQMYALPDEFFLYVGSIIERKNLLNICKALVLSGNDPNLPLVVIGEGGRYKQQVKEYIKEAGLELKVIFLSENPRTISAKSFQSAIDFPAIYQSASAMIYPSFFEGFGIPVLEALWSRLPVITSNLSSLPEAGGDGVYYVDPSRPEEISIAMKKLYHDKIFAGSLVEKGWIHAQKFTTERTSKEVMKVYDSVKF